MVFLISVILCALSVQAAEKFESRAFVHSFTEAFAAKQRVIECLKNQESAQGVREINTGHGSVFVPHELVIRNDAETARAVELLGTIAFHHESLARECCDWITRALSIRTEWMVDEVPVTCCGCMLSSEGKKLKSIGFLPAQRVSYYAGLEALRRIGVRHEKLARQVAIFFIKQYEDTLKPEFFIRSVCINPHSEWGRSAYVISIARLEPPAIRALCAHAIFDIGMTHQSLTSASIKHFWKWHDRFKSSRPVWEEYLEHLISRYEVVHALDISPDRHPFLILDSSGSGLESIDEAAEKDVSSETDEREEI